ncbi:hypothetical protein [Streptomyces sp. NPDC004538]|uniref:hypothetical protein n=1 Tax=Streptomyces sp. NPDC004538 TaxID=3154279 RepID=UPI0033B85336
MLFVTVYHRTNPTMRQPDPLSKVSAATVRQVIQGLGPLPALEPACTSQDALEQPSTMDATPIPARNRKTGASSHNDRLPTNGQVITDTNTRQAITATHPAPDTTTDTPASQTPTPATHSEQTTTPGHDAYLTTGLIVPHRKRPGRPRPCAAPCRPGVSHEPAFPVRLSHAQQTALESYRYLRGRTVPKLATARNRVSHTNGEDT